MSVNSDNTIQELVDFVNDLSNQLAIATAAINSLQDGVISTLDLEDGAVTNPKLADDAVDEIKILDSAVTNPKIADGSIDQNKMAVTLYNSMTRTSSEGQTGRIQIATEAETLAGTNTLKAVVPAYLRSYVDAASINNRLPVGSLYLNGASDTNPNVLLGYGTWAKFGAGRMLVNIDGTQTEFDTMTETGGTKTHTHTVGGTAISVAQMPYHTHSYTDRGANINVATTNTVAVGDDHEGTTLQTGGQGGGQTHTHSLSSDSNLPPYIVCAIWIRTA